MLPIDQIEKIILDKVSVEVLDCEVVMIGALNAAICIVEYLKEMGIELPTENEDLK